MKPLIVALAWAISLSSLASCGGEVSLQLPQDETLNLSVYNGGRPLKEEPLPPTGNKHHLLSLWLSANRDGWSTTPLSYVPGVDVTGKGFSINFLGKDVIINYHKRQYIKSVDPKDYEFLLGSP